MLNISLDAMQIMDAIDRNGSFAGAANELFRVPSTISYTVSKLESELGIALFERFGPKIRLTDAGSELLTEGRYLLKAATDLESRIRRVATGWETELTIGMDSLFSPAMLKEEIHDFFSIAGPTRLRFLSESLSGTWEALLDRRADILIGAAGDGPSGGGYTTRLLGTLHFAFVVAPSHPLAGVDRILTRNDLQQHRAVAVTDSARLLPARTVGLNFGQNVISVPDMALKHDFQRAGIGFGFLPSWLVQDDLATGKLVEKQVAEPKPDESFYLAWRTGETGAALTWWRERAQAAGWFSHLQK